MSILKPVPPLPTIMVAPNGARRTTRDHPALPVTIAQTVAAAIACHGAGADGLHAHVRDEQQRHVLDAGLYRELLAELYHQLPDFYVQITTEAVGRYSPADQRKLVEALHPRAVSISISEMLSEGETHEIGAFYHRQADNQTVIQHILYSPDELDRLFDLQGKGIVPAGDLHLLFVLGRYAVGQISQPSDLDPFLEKLAVAKPSLSGKIDWACCAFGKQETNCLRYALTKGGKARIGFENNLFNVDGSLARDNAERVTDLKRAMTG